MAELLPIADRWFERVRVDDEITLLRERTSCRSCAATSGTSETRERDVLVDSGMGLVSLADEVADLADEPITAVIEHRAGAIDQRRMSAASRATLGGRWSPIARWWVWGDDGLEPNRTVDAQMRGPGPAWKGVVMSHTWQLEINFTEDGRTTRADVVLDAAGHRHHGWGRAKRDPLDEDVPAIGEEVAAARALIRLAHELLGAAENEIEEIEQHPVRIHT